MAAIREHCVPWVLDRALNISNGPTSVRLNASRVVTACLVAVGASLSNMQAPSTHARFLCLPKALRMRLLCGVEPDASSFTDDNDESWLRDDVPSAQWLAGRADPEDVHNPAGAPTRTRASFMLSQFFQFRRKGSRKRAA